MMIGDTLRRVKRGVSSSVATMTNTTAADAFGFPSGRKFDICQNKVRWMAFRAGTTLSLYKSVDGETWTVSSTTFALGSSTSGYCFFIDLDDYAHIMYVDDEAELVYRRGTPNAGRTEWMWSGFTSVAIANNPDMVVHREGTGWVAHIIYDSGSSVTYRRITITSGGVVTLGAVQKNESVTNNTRWPSIDFHHTGDGKTVKSATPHIFYTWSKGAGGSGNGTRYKMWSYSGGSWNQQQEREISILRYTTGLSHWCILRFDGTRAVMVGFVAKSTGGDILFIAWRDVGDTTTTESFISDMTSAEALFYGSASFEPVTGDIYVIGLNNDEAAGSKDLVYRKWTRSGGSLGAEVVLDSGVGSTPYVNALTSIVDGRFEFIYEDDNVSLYDLMFQGVAI